MKKYLVIGFSVAGLLGMSAWSATIPDRPEKLQYPALVFNPPKAQEYRVELKSGPVAYLVPDHELPLVTVTVLVRTGNYVVPEGREGLGEVTGDLLTKGGAGQWTAEELDEKVDFLAAHVGSSIGETHGTVSLNLLSKDLPEGLSILRAVLTEPRFQENKLTLEKAQILSAIKQRNDDSSDIEAREVNYLGFGDKFFLNRHVTADSLAGLKVSDLREFHRRWFFPGNFILAVSGDFDRAQMTETLEKFFSDWPIPAGEAAPAVPSEATFGAPGTYIINKDVNQGRVSIFLPGIKRDDPEYFGALVMNDILGGGGFTSHLMNRIRSDEGLAYSVFSRLDGGVYFPQLFRTGFQSKSRTVPYAVSIVLEELKTMTEKKVTKEELENSKRGFIERLPRYFATKTQVVNLFAQDELTGRYLRDPNFWQEYRQRVQKVSDEDVEKIAQRLIVNHKPIILIVGNRDDILKGHPKYDVDLAKKFGPIKELPMRDPLTLKLGALP